VSQLWHNRLSRELRIGVGVHTGIATVGNVGSRRRLKYGPRGATVNLAARVETATKKLRLPVLITAATAQQLTKDWMTFRVCQAGLSGVAQAIDLYAVTRPVTDPVTLQDLDRYQKALSLFESGKFEDAEAVIAPVLPHGGVVPFRFLADEIEVRRHRQLGRRSSDACSSSPGPAIAIDLFT
jgi:adenylate cyclase